MIKKIKDKLTGGYQKSQQTIIDDDWLQPPTISEDIFLSNGISRKSSIISDNELSPPSVNCVIQLKLLAQTIKTFIFKAKADE